MTDAKICMNCTNGDAFKPRPDEIERYGADVMGCKRRNWEGYKSKFGTCEAFSYAKERQSHDPQ